MPGGTPPAPIYGRVKRRGTRLKVGLDQVGTVRALFRYPVKSMLGERTESFFIGEDGPQGDRAFALRDVSAGGITSAKKWGDMFRLRAWYQGDAEPGNLAALRIDLGGGRSLRGDAGDLARVLSGFLGREVVLERARPGERATAIIDYRTAFGDLPLRRIIPELKRIIPGLELEGGELPAAGAQPVSKKALRAGSFHDAEALHILATGTLDHMAALGGAGSRFDVRRFRPNILVDTGRETGFVEDRWVGGILRVGDSVRANEMRPSIRCVMTTHAQDDLARDSAILRTIADHHNIRLGVFASVAATGRVRVGDPVFLEH